MVCATGGYLATQFNAAMLVSFFSVLFLGTILAMQLQSKSKNDSKDLGLLWKIPEDHLHNILALVQVDQS